MSEPSSPPLSAAQHAEYTRLEQSLRKRGLPDDVVAFLLALRRHLLLAELKQVALARRAAQIEGTPPEGRARVGHDRNGEPSRKRVSDELVARDGPLPHPAYVQAIAEAYAARHAEPLAPVLKRLTGLQNTAQVAVAAKREQTLQEGARQPTYGDLKAVREERDHALHTLERAGQELAELRTRYNELSSLELERAKDAHGMQERIAQLQSRVEQLREQVTERDQALANSHRRAGELETQTLTLRAQSDQLAAEVAELREQLAQANDVRKDLPPDTSAQQLSRTDGVRRRRAAARGWGATPWSARVDLAPPAPRLRPYPPTRHGTQTVIDGVDDWLVEDVINDVQRGRVYQRGPEELGAPSRVVLDIYAAALRHLKHPARDMIDMWDSRWVLSSWHYGLRISWPSRALGWMFVLRLPVLAAALAVACLREPTGSLALPWIGAIAGRWLPGAVLAICALAAVAPSLAARLPEPAPPWPSPLLTATLLGFLWPLALLVLTVRAPASWLYLPELGTSWQRLTPAAAVLVGGLALSSQAAVRRFLPASVLALLTAAALTFGWYWSGWPEPRGPSAGWTVLAAVALIVCLTLGWRRYRERFFYAVARRNTHTRLAPALADAVNRAARFERRDSSPPAHALGPQFAVDHPTPFTVVMQSPDRVAVTYEYKKIRKTEARPVSRTPTIIKSGPPAVEPSALRMEKSYSHWFPISRGHDPNVIYYEEIWLFDEGDAVRQGDPIAVSAYSRKDRFSRRHNLMSLEWTFACNDGVIVQLSPRLHSGRPGHAYIRPTGYPFSALDQRETPAVKSVGS